MDPLAPVGHLIDKTEELLGHSPHPAIVELPVGAWAVSNICDTIGLLTGDERFDDVARISMAIGLAGAAAAAVTGIRDYSFIPEDRPSHDVATRHALGNALAGSLFTASYIARMRDHAQGRRTSLSARLLGLAGGSLALYTAWLGGVLVQEYGEAVKPVMEHQDEEDEGHGRERLAPESPLGLHRR
jgi:uncharacterized membrane protein